MFVWSFYENQQTEAFLQAACEYFLGEVPKESGGLVERLQQGLRINGLPHLLVLDGLERVQATGVTGRPRGEVEDPLLKRFIRWLAAGLGTWTKALITSRFTLPDLQDWKGRGFRSHDLRDLDSLSARAVFRKWRVKGSDAKLDALAGRVHRHALTVDVLGSYLGTFHAGDPTKAPSFDLELLTDTDPKVAKLGRVLASYAEKLLPQERALLSRLSMFPRGVGLDVLGHVVTAGGEIAGALTGATSLSIRKLLERLRTLGLVFQYDARGEASFTAHPFLRDFFARIHGMRNPRQLFEAVRQQLLVDEDLTTNRPTDPKVLDKYELLIEMTRLAGRIGSAFDLYCHQLGNYEHLIHSLGEHSRGLRILSNFSEGGTPDDVCDGLSPRQRAVVANDWGLVALHLGDLATARWCFTTYAEYTRCAGDSPNHSRALMNLYAVEASAGRWAVCKQLGERSLVAALPVAELIERRGAYTAIAEASFYLGDTGRAWHYYRSADELDEDHPLYGELRVQLVDGLMASGSLALAKEQAEFNRRISEVGGRWAGVIACCEVQVGLCIVHEDRQQALSHLTAAQAYAGRSGDVQVILRCHYLAAKIAVDEGDLSRAIFEARDGIQLADSCGFGRWSLDIRTELARIHLANNDPKATVEPAVWVLKRSREEDCQYAWGIADSLHLLGVAHARLGDKRKAREYLTEAVEKRKPLEHPGLADTEDELRKLG